VRFEHQNDFGHYALALKTILLYKQNHFVTVVNMKVLVVCILAVFSVASVYSQTGLREMEDAEKSFITLARDSGPKQAFLKFLSVDSVVFQPAAENGRAVWEKIGNSTAILERNSIFADISANGAFGYTTGNWKSYERAKPDSAKFGQYVTIWQRTNSGAFQIVLDITTGHEEFPAELLDKYRGPKRSSGDRNKKGWSAADATMAFYRIGNNQSHLGGAYQEYASSLVRLLIDGDAPIYGKKDAVYRMFRYRYMDFPSKIVMMEAADMAYVWNPCEYADSEEGKEKGNCLHIWKLRDEKWWIVMGVFASANDASSTPPQLRVISPKTKKNSP
jgi:hypothetical protein